MTQQPVSLLFSAALSFVWASVAFSAQSPVVYHSPAMNGVNPGTPHSIVDVTDTLELYYSPGPTATTTGEVCLDGNGDEICGITVEILATGSVALVTFNEDVSNDLVVNFSPPGSLKINRLNGTVGDSGPIRLGSLDITAGVGTGDISVATTSESTGASLQTLAVLDNNTIAVPEPAVLIGLWVGVSALGFAARRGMGAR